MATLTCCGILFTQFCSIDPKDQSGCALVDGHAGPHEFTDDRGEGWYWETDWECACAECLGGEGDFCTVYWRKRKRR